MTWEPAGCDFASEDHSDGYRVASLAPSGLKRARLDMISDTIERVGSDLTQGGKPAHTSAADLLSLAATPTFVVMALLSAIHRGSTPEICAAAGDRSPLTGMVTMYVSMSVFHLAPWLRLLSGRERDAPRS